MTAATNHPTAAVQPGDRRIPLLPASPPIGFAAGLDYAIDLLASLRNADGYDSANADILGLLAVSADAARADARNPQQDPATDMECAAVWGGQPFDPADTPLAAIAAYEAGLAEGRRLAEGGAADRHGNATQPLAVSAHRIARNTKRIAAALERIAAQGAAGTTQ